MFNKLLIANRGEIACRVIKTANRLGIATVAVHSDVDANALHVQLADEAIEIGPAPAKDSYLQGEKIIAAALSLGVDAIHPGYGFLSENAQFAALCEQHQIAFVGPPVAAIAAMGSKSSAKQIMAAAEVPLVPGYHGEEQSPATLKQHADTMGYPVLLKAAAGGGGKGMREVWSEGDFNAALDAAKREARSSFADDHMLLEKFLLKPRHVEIQVFCDQHGNGVFLFERDCSLQRRHQKVIEEAPAPGISAKLRSEMGAAALLAAKAINYVGAGTVEFLLDSDGAFYFMEMNTRLQVEHPVTEKITGQDLVEWQLRVAAGEPLPLTQGELAINGHAFEARIYAEDPDHDFLPATGVLRYLRAPRESEHVRVDTGVLQGDAVSVYYDPMIAKLIVWDEDRHKALLRLRKALRDYRIHGLVNNIPFLSSIANTAAFAAAELHTGFIAQHQEQLAATPMAATADHLPVIATAVMWQKLTSQQQNNGSALLSPWDQLTAWRANDIHTHPLTLEWAGQLHHISVAVVQTTHRQDPAVYHFDVHWCQQTTRVIAQLTPEGLSVNVNGHRQLLECVTDTEHSELILYTQEHTLRVQEHLPDLGLTEELRDDQGFTAPMNGTVVKLLVAPEQRVDAGEPLLIMEAMKMEHTLTASRAGAVTEFYCQVGDLVDGGAALLAFEEENNAAE